VQFAINRNPAGWVVELVNNDGVVKSGRTPARVFPEVVAKVALSARVPWREAREWLTAQSWTNGAPVVLDIPPGESRFVEFIR
jgi:hypothetical protein